MPGGAQAVEEPILSKMQFQSDRFLFPMTDAGACSFSMKPAIILGWPLAWFLARMRNNVIFQSVGAIRSQLTLIGDIYRRKERAHVTIENGFA